MFNGEERVTMTTEMPPDDFDAKAQECLEALGNVDISSGGSFTVSPKTALASFLSTVTLTGKIKQTDDGYQVTVQYTLAPSPACWILAIVLFCATGFGAAIIIAPLVIDKPNVSKAAESALRDLKDSFGSKKRSRKGDSDE